jgi:general secretion pathway protein K
MSRARQQGIVLVLVLWALVLLTVIVSAVSSSVHTETTLAHYQLEQTRLRAQADAAFLYAAARAFDPDSERRWLMDGSPHHWQFDGVEMSIRLQADETRVDLNFASAQQLHDLLEEQGLEPEQIDAVVDALIDWRDADNLHRLHGAEDPDYAAAGLPYGAKDAPYASVDEIGLVLGVSAKLKTKLMPYLTVSGLGSVAGAGGVTVGGTGGDDQVTFVGGNNVWVWVEIVSTQNRFRATAWVRQSKDRMRLDKLHYDVSLADWPQFEEE